MSIRFEPGLNGITWAIKGDRRIGFYRQTLIRSAGIEVMGWEAVVYEPVGRDQVIPTTTVNSFEFERQAQQLLIGKASAVTSKR